MKNVSLFILVFFFSSRRRHTRWTGDWSSDVCSSDLSRAGLQVPLSPPTGSALSGGLRGVPADLLRGEVLLVGGDAPADAERIDHAAEPVAPEHVAARRSPATRAMRRGRWYSPAGHE